MGIKGVFLDLGWTLFRPAHSDWFINSKMLEFASWETICNIPKEKRDAVFGKALAYLDAHHLLKTEEEEIAQFTDFYRMIAAGLPELEITREQAREIAVFKVLDTSNYLFFEKARKTILELREKYKIGIISDTWPSIDRILQSGEMADLFDYKTYSCHLGVYKPHEKMYLHALAQMNLPPEQTVFVDDGEENLDGAAACGIRPILIRTRENAPDSGRYPHIDSIEQLSALLESPLFA